MSKVDVNVIFFGGGSKNKQIDIFAFLSHATTHFQNSNFRLFHIYFTVAKVVSHIGASPKNSVAVMEVLIKGPTLNVHSLPSVLRVCTTIPHIRRASQQAATILHDHVAISSD